MDFDKVVEKRRSVRKYKNTDVPKEIIEKIINQTVTYSPSANNLQPWKFLVISDEKIKQKIVAMCKRNSYMMNAPYIVIALSNQVECYEIIGNYMRSDVIDVSIAITHLILAATNEGLGSCWVGAFEADKIEHFLEIAYPWRILALIPIGYPDETGTYVSRKPSGEVVEWVG
ncbi:MAG: nitroreductase [Candidatus Margulisiibacteriota bacterium]|nr:MAG: hypothetical protein A2X43_13505 [Candidatus Margulisbacteria bacterium GWD2_39_127]OGI04727.1 MAG: hypothetical protein A2X42_10490 [Candidatus Margulisbacteria bacterium GWF2_38_17]OGI05672.1 MAG: hypothetical protein A2X41_03075 [Candidatus Margulisbacteria bacterium GWE2_39_32]PZM83606.1 MAG: nitroreductase [Candidatus Margulisiibacteriota bacterium]HAR62024.1 nitroreductase [Candidatus Margulisiibacteriota bacterium]